MKVFITSSAKQDMYDIVKFIVSDNPKAAREWLDSIVEYIEKISSFPNMGRIVPEYNENTIREIIHDQHRIVYKINENDQIIYIIAVHHSKKLLH